MTVLDSGFHPVDSGLRVLDSEIPAQWIPDSKFFFCFNVFLRISFSCSNLAVLKRRCLECIASLFSFSIYKFREEIFNVLLFRRGLRYYN